MATSVRFIPCATASRAQQLAELDESIDHYSRLVDEGSCHQVSRLRRIRSGILNPQAPTVTTVACASRLS